MKPALVSSRITTVRPRSTLEVTGVALGLALLTLVLHLATAGRFDFLRDELYFIVCGRHPALGYVDQPPLIPLWAAFSQMFGENLILLRLPAGLAAAGTVYLVCAFARLAGAGRFGEFLAGFAFAIAPMTLGRGYTLDTTILEGPAWTLCAYLVARRIVLDDRGAMIWLGIVVGIALEAKYSIPLYVIALTAGLLCTPQRRIILTREVAVAAVIAIVLAAPSLVWQSTHGWPFIELLRNGSNGKNVVAGPLAFALNQVAVNNPLFAPVWIAGIVAPFRMRSLAPLRGIAIGFLVVSAMMIVLHAKDYYLAAAFGAMFALGGAAVEGLVRNAIARSAYIVLATSFSVAAAPLALPVLAPAPLVAYMRSLHLAPRANEVNQEGTPLPQSFADQFGWRELARTVRSHTKNFRPRSARARSSSPKITAKRRHSTSTAKTSAYRPRAADTTRTICGVTATEARPTCFVSTAILRFGKRSAGTPSLSQRSASPRRWRTNSTGRSSCVAICTNRLHAFGRSCVLTTERSSAPAREIKTEFYLPYLNLM